MGSRCFDSDEGDSCSFDSDCKWEMQCRFGKCDSIFRSNQNGLASADNTLSWTVGTAEQLSFDLPDAGEWVVEVLGTNSDGTEHVTTVADGFATEAGNVKVALQPTARDTGTHLLRVRQFANGGGEAVVTLISVTVAAH